MNTEIITGLLGGLSMLLGAIIISIAAVGLLRLPDVLCRGHAAGKALTLGIFLMLGGFWLFHPGFAAGLKIALAIVFQAVTIPVASQLVAQAAHDFDVPRSRPRTRNETDIG